MRHLFCRLKARKHQRKRLPTNADRRGKRSCPIWVLNQPCEWRSPVYHQAHKRTAQGISLTGPGLRLMARAEVILQSLERARAEVETWDREPSGPVSVALIPAIGSLVAPALVRALRERYPKVSLHLSEGLSTWPAAGSKDTWFRCLMMEPEVGHEKTDVQ